MDGGIELYDSVQRSNGGWQLIFLFRYFGHVGQSSGNDKSFALVQAWRGNTLQTWAGGMRMRGGTVRFTTVYVATVGEPSCSASVYHKRLNKYLAYSYRRTWCF